MTLCLHFGPGQLGLGLIVDQLLDASFDVCLVGRPGTRDPKYYGLSLSDPGVGLRYRRVRWPTDATEVAGLPAEVQALIGSPKPVLMTAALDEHASGCKDLVTDIVRRRPAGAKTYLVVCENVADPVYAQLARELGPELEVLDAVVDRICAWPKTGKYDDHGRRVVEAHEVGEWVMARPRPLPDVLEQLERAPLVRFVEPPLQGWKERKLWTVNGIHLVLAMVARVEGVDRLPLTGARLEAFLELAQPLTSLITGAVRHAHPEVDIDEGYVHDRIRAFCESEDTTYRILKSLVREDLRPFVQRLADRICAPAGEAHAAGMDCERFADVIALVLRLLANDSRYYPAKEPAELNPEVDAEVVERFREMLGWMDDQRADEWSAQLRRDLAAQRDL